jgi:hypothetical protein
VHGVPSAAAGLRDISLLMSDQARPGGISRKPEVFVFRSSARFALVRPGFLVEEGLLGEARAIFPGVSGADSGDSGQTRCAVLARAGCRALAVIAFRDSIARGREEGW